MHCISNGNGLLCLSFYDNNLPSSYTNSIRYDNGECCVIGLFTVETESLGYALRGRTVPNVQRKIGLSDRRNL